MQFQDRGDTLATGELVEWTIHDKGHLILSRQDATADPVPVKKRRAECATGPARGISHFGICDAICVDPYLFLEIVGFSPVAWLIWTRVRLFGESNFPASKSASENTAMRISLSAFRLKS
jgi:hypothetical protein